MKTVFIVNPAAGKKNDINALAESIRGTCEKSGAEYEIYITKCVGDATDFIKKYCADFGNARFIACGGDGTFCEVLEGAMAFPGNEIGVFPMGTGNDFCRNFGDDCDFHSIGQQLSCKTVFCDAIKYTSLLDGRKKVGYCANMVNIGFDCNVAVMTAEMKKKPFVSGSFAYFLSILACLIGKKGAQLEILTDGEKVHSGRLLLTSVANGCFCGGGIKSNPIACINDGFINVNIIKNVTRLRFLSLLPHYMKGTHHSVRGVDKIIVNKKCKSISVLPQNGRSKICIDGEIYETERVDLEIVPDAFCFVLPKEYGVCERCAVPAK